MNLRLRTLHAFIVKELHHILRDRQTLAVLLLMPLVQVVLFGYALRTDVRDVRIAFVDPVPDATTRALRTRFAGNGRFTVVAELQSQEALAAVFRRGDADVALVFEPGFGSRLADGRGANLLVIADASDPNTATQRQTYVQAVIAGYQAERPSSNGVHIETRTRMRFNPTLESVNLFVPGLIALVLTLVSALMSAISLSREKERGTLEILLVSPLRPWQVIVGKVAPYLLLAFANVVTALLAAWAIFQVPFRGSVLLLMLASILFALVSLAFGVLVAALTTSQRAAMLAALLVTMLPTTLLSGMVFPISSLPDWLQVVSAGIPARWFIVIARGIMLKGVGLPQLWLEFTVLLGMLVLFMSAAMRSFRPRLT